MAELRKRRRIGPLAIALGLWAGSSPAHALATLQEGSSLGAATHLVEVAQNNRISRQVRGWQNGGFEAAGGQWVGFDRWYATHWRDTRLSWMTQINRHVGVIWGLSTGEKAPKYAIEPGLRLGFIVQAQPHRNAYVAVSGSTVMGGRLRERPCTADYGDIGGIQTVNCRLAATELEPAATLKYLYNVKPESTIQVSYRYFFD